jgi:hypothetical protein
MTRKVYSPLLLLPLVVLAGCRPGNPNAPASVSGQVTYKGETLTAGAVSFHSKEKGIFQAPIEPDGTFRAVDIPAGDLAVTVETESANPELAKKTPDYKGGFGGGGDSKYGKGGGGKKQQPAKKAAQTSPTPEGMKQGGGKYVKIPSKYSDPGKSGLSAKISAGKNDGLKFELTD